MDTTWSVDLTYTGGSEFDYSLGKGDQEPALIEVYVNDFLATLSSGDAVPDASLACPSVNGFTSFLGFVDKNGNTVTGMDTSGTSITDASGSNGESGTVVYSFEGSITTSQAYFDKSASVKVVQWCIRITNQATDGTRANVRELAMTHTIDVNATIISTNGILVDGVAPAQGTDTSAAGAYAFFCQSNGNQLSGTELATPLNQGDSVYVCVEPQGAISGVADIDSLSLMVTDSGVSVSQQFVNNGSVSGSALKTCSGGSCIVEVLLGGEFFIDSTNFMTVEAVGEAILNLGSRRGRTRELLKDESRSYRTLQSVWERKGFGALRVMQAKAKKSDSHTDRMLAFAVGAMGGVILAGGVFMAITFLGS